MTWQPIETAPKMQTILLWAATDIADDGTVRNWRMATGFWHTGYEDERSRANGYTPWSWAGHQLRAYEVQPTRWMPLPDPPTVDESKSMDARIAPVDEGKATGSALNSSSSSVPSGRSPR